MHMFKAGSSRPVALAGRLVQILVVAAAVAATAASVRGVWAEYLGPTTPPRDSISDWKAIAAQGQRIGSPDAMVVVVVYSDYECGACQRFDERADQLLDRYPATLAIVVRHFPLEIHRSARPAARAAICATELGAFAPYHRALLANADSLEVRSWSSYAKIAGIADTRQFESCLQSARPDSVLARDIRSALRVGIVGTPTLLVNGAVYSGVPGDFERIVRRHVRGDGAT